ncbi:zinc-finger-containing protein [Motilimonas eburnea]|uniref:zinc-finger-containing protein n=1 Tax=Motilimonas eburnea TaxID=1737488 RepID=UPI001E2CF50C|nr:zinc-finger-containing protein [Motilimonas eburnea]MCE2571721.1 DUF3268 family zinc-finger domain-containing protein [Motilimonas eburnea]
MKYRKISQLDPVMLLTAQFRRSHIPICQVDLDAHAARLDLLFKPHKRKYLNRVSANMLFKNINAMTELSTTEHDCLRYTALVFSEWQRGYFSKPVQCVKLACPYCQSHCSIDHDTQMYCCDNKDCDASVPYWQGDHLPLGTPANAELRQQRQAVESLVVPVLANNILTKVDLHKRLLKCLGMPPKSLFNIYNLDSTQCDIVSNALIKLQPVQRAM